jgi:hypothetical protein
MSEAFDIDPRLQSAGGFHSSLTAPEMNLSPTLVSAPPEG